MMGRRIVRADARRRPRRAHRFTRLLSLLLVSVIGLGVAQSAGETAMEDEAEGDERIVFRHFV
ncbi:hypothetical protein [Methylobacterium sp. Leaf456]|uniref:hypothetical protein n=1 Tax=Methylobacterium sp. Leaf456 TaxID=1736382 RepID=UPI0012E38907|nr:hypothetical protein [Methylobacterium sp. Leaf456]